MLHVGRYIDTIIYGCHYNQATQDSREKKEMFLRFYVYEEADATLLRLLECFMESAPQLVLQLYILTQVHPETMVIFGTLVPPSVQTGLLVLSIFLSLCSMSWCLAFYQRALRHTQDDKCNLNLPGLIMQFVWRFLTIGSRVLALALFASTFRYYVLLVCLIRYLLMTTWILSMKTSFYDNKCEEFFYNCVLGVMYIFCYFNPKDTPTRRRYTIFYLLTFVENTLLISLWFRETADCPPWYRLPAVLAQPLLFLLGLLFMVSVPLDYLLCLSTPSFYSKGSVTGCYHH
ncbi:XKR6 [Cordylochernes scorpioides]|uniref:XK-related protein n=1 Tax=Cordylochernes scorpioides TaxID=51811 RepID=A0ABY6LEN2_9ARAC|nr:XKR6 [Cordylochernes scorpioides]